MPRFRDLPTDLMDLPEIEQELAYQSKRLYRLRKLQKLGHECEPDLSMCQERETALDLELRMRRFRMAEIPG